MKNAFNTTPCDINEERAWRIIDSENDNYNRELLMGRKIKVLREQVMDQTTGLPHGSVLGSVLWYIMRVGMMGGRELVSYADYFGLH